MAVKALTDVFLRTVPLPATGRTEFTDARCRGLTLRVTATGEKTWAFRYRDPSGRTQRLTLGRYPDMALSDARARADDERRKVAGGASPAAEKRAERQNANTLCFDHLADRYLREHAYRFKKSAGEDERSLRLHLRPSWGRKRYAEIRRRDVVELIEAIYASGRPALAVRLKATVSKIFAFAISKDLMDVNPAAGIGRIADLAPRERVLSDDEIRFAWQAFIIPPVSAKVGLALRLVLATGQRPGEVAGLRWNELRGFADPGNALWIIPAERAKNGREHTVPLSPLAVSLLSEVQNVTNGLGGQEHAFESPRGAQAISAHALAVAMARIAGAKARGTPSGAHQLAHMRGWNTWMLNRPTPHDLRRTAATRMRALGTSSEDVRHVLNHSQSSVLRRHYDRYDPLLEKRRALEAWANELQRIVTEAPP